MLVAPACSSEDNPQRRVIHTKTHTEREREKERESIIRIHELAKIIASLIGMEKKRREEKRREE